ncbi:MAG: hypothetical protein K9N09_07295 [Candidatus Cloacimonetes bacterium]|nr:hypothetical protein [Candidatus Cloacimonadota bacterium]MCF7813807.1 hypothetical protein [Candidatus Cloacimonadota bacterium]MCF7868486.1 hypothetical protein [Candidatus Cloacimonadota bacterium]
MRYLAVLILTIFLINCSSDNSNSGINPLPNFDVMWDYAHPDSTEMRFKEILPLLTQTSEFSVSDEYNAELLTQIARAQGLQGKFNEAAKNLEKADSLITDKMPTAKIRYLLEKGRLLNTMNQTEEANKLFFQAYEFGKKDSLDFYTLDAAHMLGFTTPLEQQLDWSLKALDIARTSDDPRCEQWEGPLYNNIGWTYFDNKDYFHAHKMFMNDFEWRKEHNDEAGARVARWSIARSLRSMFKFDEALHIQLALEKDLQENNLPPDGYVYEELTELYQAKNNIPKMKEYAKKAYDVLSQDSWLMENDPNRIERLKELSK